MARVRVLPAIVHTSYGHAPGDEVDLRDDIAETWVAAGLAERVEQAPDTPERAQQVETPEDAAQPGTPERGRRTTARSRSRKS